MRFFSVWLDVPETDIDMILKLMFKLKKLGHLQLLPNYIENESLASFLHEAVLLQNVDLVKQLIASGANTELKATYLIKPKNIKMKVTPLELAEYLGNEDIINLFKNTQGVDQTLKLANFCYSLFYQQSLNQKSLPNGENEHKKVDECPKQACKIA